MTVLHSTIPVNWNDEVFKPQPNGLRVETNMEIDRFDDGAIVLKFKSQTLTQRHEELLKAGASSDYPTYTPHITLGYSKFNYALLGLGFWKNIDMWLKLSKEYRENLLT